MSNLKCHVTLSVFKSRKQVWKYKFKKKTNKRRKSSQRHDNKEVISASYESFQACGMHAQSHHLLSPFCPY